MSHDDGDCRRCGAAGSWLDTSGVILSGVYLTRLCIDCRNDWDEYIVQHPTRLAKDGVGIAVDMAFAQSCGDGVDRTDVLTRLHDEHRAIDWRLRELAIEWVAATITRAAD